jgi:hypothetical protein
MELDLWNRNSFIDWNDLFLRVFQMPCLCQIESPSSNEMIFSFGFSRCHGFVRLNFVHRLVRSFDSVFVKARHSPTCFRFGWGSEIDSRISRMQVTLSN